MQHTTSKQLFEYWDQVRGGRFAPNRFEIEPARLSSILPDVFIAECPDASTYRFRLAGTRICTALGHEMRGHNLLDYWSGDDREAVQNMLHIVVQDGAGVRFSFEWSDAGREAAEFETLVLPLVHRGHTVTRMLGSIAPLTQPYWAGTVELRHFSLLSFDFIWPEVTSPLPPQTEEPVALASADTQFAGDARRRFRVYEGGLSKRAD